MEKNMYMQKFRSGSQVLNPVNNSLNRSFIPSDINNLKTWLLEIQGNGNGEYYDPRNAQSYPGDKIRERGFAPSKIVRLQDELKHLEEQHNKYVEGRLASGYPKPTEWPERALHQKKTVEARIQVANEEIDKLKELIAKLEQKKAEGKGKHLLGDPRYWSAGNLRDGILVQVGPWKVKPDEEGLLRISDPTSPYDSMPVWQFRSQVVRPMYQEFKYRREHQTQLAKKNGVMCGAVPYPKPPKFDKASGQLEYSNYHNNIIKKIKQES